MVEEGSRAVGGVMVVRLLICLVALGPVREGHWTAWIEVCAGSGWEGTEMEISYPGSGKDAC